MRTLPINLADIDAIIFDLGGVILPLAPQETLHAFTRLLGVDASTLYTLRKQHSLFDSFERGEVEASYFRSQLLQLSRSTNRPSPHELDQAWNAMLGQIPDENLNLLKRLRSQKRTFVLSNTNEIHIAQFLTDFDERHRQIHGQWDTLFEKVHYSHVLKMRKPEVRIFEELLRRHQLDGERTLFLDDNQTNIKAASEAGMIGVYHPLNTSLTERFGESPPIENKSSPIFLSPAQLEKNPIE